MINFNNRRTRKTVKRALGMTLGMLDATKPRQMSTRFIDQHFSAQTNATGKWLRSTLLVQHSNWNMETGKCIEYTYNPEGVALVKQYLDVPQTVNTQHERLQNRGLGLEWANTEYDFESVEYADKSRRLWHPIQNMPKSIRNSYLKTQGLRLQYDIRSAAPSLLYQYSWRYSGGIVLDTIDHYINNKDSVRARLAEESGLPVANIKVLINSLFAGAVLGASSRFSCWEYCNKDASVVLFFKQHPYITDLRSDIKQMWEYLRPALPVTTQTLSNGKTRRVQMSPRNKWHLYFGLERSVLNEIKSYLELVGVRYFLIHDAFVSEPLPYGIDDLSQWVEAGTDFCVRFDQEHLSYYD